jgi:hypothetical protein
MAAEVDGDERSHPRCIKLPPAVEVFANLKNAQTFAIDIGMSSIGISLPSRN